MDVPFTVAEFFDVFRRYNQGVWPGQWGLYALALLAVGLGVPRGGRGTATSARRLVAAILAFFWAWMGVVYHLVFFRAINPAATLFGVLFVGEALLFAWLGVWRGRLGFGIRRGAPGVFGGLVVAYALIGYPALGYLLGHRYPATPTFGLPCPTTIFTLGLLLWAERPFPRILLVVPMLWALVGGVAALRLGVPEDLGLPLAGATLLLAGRGLGTAPDRVVNVPRSRHTSGAPEGVCGIRARQRRAREMSGFARHRAGAKRIS